MQLARRGCKNLLPNLAPVGPEIRIARDFMLAGKRRVRIDRLHFRGQASRTYLTVIIITHSVKVAGIVCVKNDSRDLMMHRLWEVANPQTRHLPSTYVGLYSTPKMAQNSFRGGNCPLPVVLDHAGLPRGSCPASVAMTDLYPEMTLEYALKLLKKQYGPESVIHWHVSNMIAVLIPPAGEENPVSVVLTIEQAKFLAANPMSPQDLVNERYPEE